jgi:hypothetical protein
VRKRKAVFTRAYAEKTTAEFKAALDDRLATGAAGAADAEEEEEEDADAALDDALDAMLDAQADADGNLFDDFDDFEEDE